MTCGAWPTHVRLFKFPFQFCLNFVFKFIWICFQFHLMNFVWWILFSIILLKFVFNFVSNFIWISFPISFESCLQFHLNLFLILFEFCFQFHLMNFVWWILFSLLFDEFCFQFGLNFVFNFDFNFVWWILFSIISFEFLFQFRLMNFVSILC
jgi:hypothetical protein